MVIVAATEKTYWKPRKISWLRLDSALDQARFGTQDLVGDDGTGVSVSIQAGAALVTLLLWLSAMRLVRSNQVGANLIDLTTDASAAIGG